jgi:FixJ family two-component response regulator
MIDEKPTIFIIDDDPSARRGLSHLVQAAEMRVQAFESGRDFLNQVRDDIHGCILLDVKMPGLSGLDLQDELMKRNSVLPIVFVSGHSDIPDAALAMKRGAVDFLTKPVDGDQLFKAITESLKKNRENRKVRTRKAEVQKRLDTLSPREYTILEFVISGMLNKQIAYELGITEDTVKVHRGRVIKKMRADSLAELIRLAEVVGVKPAEVND